MKLTKNWRKCWRYFSTQSMVVAGAIQGAWAATPLDMRETIPENSVVIATVTVLILGAIGRVTNQGIDDADTD